MIPQNEEKRYQLRPLPAPIDFKVNFSGPTITLELNLDAVGPWIAALKDPDLWAVVSPADECNCVLGQHCAACDAVARRVYPLEEQY